MNSRFIIIGLPASGKTTFLAALWHLVSSAETECRMELDRYEGDLAYLNKIAEAWRNFRPVPRTSQFGDVDVTICLRDTVAGTKGTALFPDLAGETFDIQIDARRCRPAFVDNVSSDDGILFFISADLKEDDLSVVELNSRLPGGASAAVGSEGDVTTKDETPGPEWEPRLIPTQVRIVQLLSDLLRPPFASRPRRLALMISAWDLAGAGRPTDWLEVRMPLVHQFLRSNSTSFVTQIYGVSAQGVNLDDETAVDEAAQLTPSRRIRIARDDDDGHDLTLPLAWLMSTA